MSFVDFFVRLRDEVVRPRARAEHQLARDAAVERLLLCLHLYPNYRVDSRGPKGLLYDAIKELRPDVAAYLQDEADDSKAYAHFFPEDE